MTPGSYLRQQRVDAGLSLDDVALRVETDPPVCARERAQWLSIIETDTALPDEHVILALAKPLALDVDLLRGLVADREQQILAGRYLKVRWRAAAAAPGDAS